MTEPPDPYLIEKTLDQLKEKYFDEYSKDLQIFRSFPYEIQIRIYFEYWFLLKKLRSEQVKVTTVRKERDSLGLTLNNFPIGRILSQISSNGCLSVYAPSDSEGNFAMEEIFDIDFNYFNKANPTYKIGKFSTEEIITTISEPDENREMIEKMYILVLFLKEHLAAKKSN